MAKSVLVDMTRCIGCRGCQIACKAWNERSARRTVMNGSFTNPTDLNSDCFTHVRFVENGNGKTPVWSFVKNQCFHCQNPACASVCPVAAFRKSDDGPVTYDYDRCIGCRYCMLACPFQVPKYEWEKLLPAVQKCTFCAERIQDGLLPACIKTCPTKTMFFGKREEVVAEAKRRIGGSPGKYVNHVYGMEEAGGTSWLYLSNVPFQELGFNMNVPKYELPGLTWSYISSIPAVIGVVLAAGIGSWFVTRRQEVKEKESGKEGRS
jgi:formate dehydrogenase iron-sulfur subunit